MSQYFSPDDPHREEVEQIRNAAERAGILTRQLLAFSRQQRLKPQFLSLNEVIKNLGKMLRRLIGEDVLLGVDLAPDLGQVKADPGQGSTFIIYLPQVGQKIEPLSSTLASAAILSGNETILLVEDETPVRLIATKMLELRGYNVVAADGPKAAVALCRQYEGQLDLLITAVIMPGMSGHELVQRLVQLIPTLRVLYISGYSNEELDKYGVLALDVDVLEKPFSLEALARKVREVLDAPLQR